jgi:hypothetical protein
VSKYVSFDNFRFGCQTADDFIIGADKKKGEKIIWSDNISKRIDTRHGKEKERK